MNFVVFKFFLKNLIILAKLYWIVHSLLHNTLQVEATQFIYKDVEKSIDFAAVYLYAVKNNSLP